VEKGGTVPSCALLNFESTLMVDVDRIIKSHTVLNHEGGGRRGLGHITRSGVLMLCAAWELYVEQLLSASAGVLADRAAVPGDLPLPVQKQIAKVVRDSKHELKPLELAGDGWMMIYRNYVGVTVGNLHTPKSTNLDPLFKRLVGFERVSNSWSVGAPAIDSFVKARCEIAHRGRDAAYVRIWSLKQYREQVISAVLDTDNAMADFIRDNSEGGSPWRRRNS